MTFDLGSHPQQLGIAPDTRPTAPVSFACRLIPRHSQETAEAMPLRASAGWIIPLPHGKSNAVLGWHPVGEDHPTHITRTDKQRSTIRGRGPKEMVEEEHAQVGQDPCEHTLQG